MEKKKLVLFDFDGTITTKDSFPLFFKFTFGGFKFYSGFLLFTPLFLLHKLKLYDGGKLKEAIQSFYLKGIEKSKIEKMGERLIQKLIADNIIKKEFTNKIETYISDGAEVVVVSASPDLWIKPFCELYKIKYLCTELAYNESKFTGNFSTPNCNHNQKKVRILEKYSLEKYEAVIVYGNSKDDECMMELATEKIWV